MQKEEKQKKRERKEKKAGDEINERANESYMNGSRRGEARIDGQQH